MICIFDLYDLDMPPNVSDNVQNVAKGVHTPLSLKYETYKSTRIIKSQVACLHSITRTDVRE